MADYQPLIARAVDGLADNSPETRRAVYERARAALLQQLRSLDPPLSESEIMRERLALDEAIDRVETVYWAGESPEVEEPAPVPAYVEPPLPEPEPPVLRPTLEPRGASVAPPAAAPAPLPAGDGLPPIERVRQDGPDEAEPEPVAPESIRSGDDPAVFDSGMESGQQAGDGNPARERPRVDMVARPQGDRGRIRSLILGVVLALVVGSIAIAAWVLRDDPAKLAREAPARPVEAPVESAENKYEDRIGGGAAPGPAPVQPAAPPATVETPAPPARPVAPAPAPAQPVVPVAQRAVLYEEDLTNPQRPKATPGRVVWRLEAVNAGQGQPLETVVRAVVEYPDVGMTLTLTMRRNTDPTLPASHTIDLAFVSPGEGRTVREAGVLLLKSDEAVRATPTAGLPVPVRDNLFLIGLSNLPADVERNTDLLRTRNWIDLPVRFASGQRAILTFEKGISGDQVMAEAFQRWR